MSSQDRQPVLIAGGGIGGLAAALGLAKNGFGSILLEKAAALGEIGAGIQLGPNAFHAFDYLGVGEAARPTLVAMGGDDTESVEVPMITSASAPDGRSCRCRSSAVRRGI